MKKTLVATILGIAAVATTFAQGFVSFNNYGGLATDAKITYGPTGGGPLNVGVNNTFSAAVFYQFGTVAWGGGHLVDPSTSGWSLAPGTATIAGPGSNGPGYFDAGVLAIPGYSSGPISFVVVAYQTSAGNYTSSLIRGSSVGFTLPSIATGLATPTEFGAGFQPFQVNLVPEPSSFALAGLGLAGLLIFRRRK